MNIGYFKNKAKKLNLMQLTIWLVCTCVFSYLLLVELPKKSFDFTDHGYYLYNALMLARGFVPAAGYAAILNVLFLKLGFIKYLFFEQLYYLFIVASVLTFWKGISPVLRSYTFPLVIIISICSNFTYMINYQTAPVLLLMLGLGLLFIALDSRKIFSQETLFFFAGLILSLSVFSNVSFFPLVIPTWFLLWLFLRNRKNIFVFHAAFFVSSFIMLVSYLFSATSLFSKSALHVQSFGDLLGKVILFLEWMFKNAFLSLSVSLLIFFISVFFALQSKNKERLKITRFNKLLVSVYQKIDSYREWIFLLLVVFFIIGAHYTNINVINYAIHCDSHPDRVSYFDTMLFYIFLIGLFVLWRANSASIRILFSSLLVISFAMTMSIATTQSFESHIAHFSTFFIAGFCILFELNAENKKEKIMTKLSKFTFIVLLIIAVVIAIYLHVTYVYRAYPRSENKILIEGGKLKGVYSSKEKIEIFNSIVRQYQLNECKNKYFLAYPVLPLLYYFFDREAPLNQVWLAPDGTNITSEQIMAILEKEKHWCIVESPGFDDTPLGYLEGLHRYIQAKSIKKNEYQSAVKPVAMDLMPYKYTFYVR